MSDRHLIAPPADRPGVDPHSTDQAFQARHGAERDPMRVLQDLWRFQQQHHYQGGVPGGIQNHRYVQPEGTRRHKVKDLEGREAIVPGPEGTFAPGQAVLVGITNEGKVLLSQPPEGRQGESQFPVSSGSGALDRLSVTDVDPDEFEVDATTSATVTGTNFKADDTIRAVEFDDDEGSLTFGEWVDDDQVSTANLVHVDAETKTVDVTIAAGTPLTHEFKLQVRRANAG